MPVEASSQPLGKAGDYDLVEMIAEGGMGTVYKGRHRTTAQIAAIKIIPAHFAANAVFLQRFKKEYEAARAIDHPNIVRAMELGWEDQLPYLVMEYVEGESLGQRLERDGRMPEAEAIRIITLVAQGLHKAHKIGLVHRDVKPDNVLLTPDGEVKLTDLGLVKDSESDLNLTRTGRGLGTPHFMAPEQFRRAKDADVRCDIYSMAATLYNMVTGELPFKACSPLDAWMKKINHELTEPRSLAPDLSERTDWAIRRSMSADPGQRAGSCREFIEDLTGRNTRRIGVAAGAPEKDLWYLAYQDEEGGAHTVKGSTAGVRRSLSEGLLGDAANIRISRSKQGPFEPLRQHPEFRDLVLSPGLPALSATMTTALSAPSPSAGKPPRTPTTPPAGPSERRTPPSVAPRAAATARPMPLPQPAGPPAGPHIPISAAQTSVGDWIKLAAVVLLALAAGLGGYFLMPILRSLQLM